MKFLTIVALALMIEGIAFAKTVATVNGEAITDKDIAPMLKMFPKAKRLEDLNIDEKEMVLDQTVEKKLIVQQARREHLHEDPKFKEVLQEFREKLLLEFWMKRELDSVDVSEEEVKAFFAKNRAHFPKDAKLEDLKAKIEDQVKVEKFRKKIDQKLSEMKKKAKIEYK